MTKMPIKNTNADKFQSVFYSNQYFIGVCVHVSGESAAIHL